MKVDLTITGGKVATSGGIFEADVYVKEGKVLAVGKVEGVTADREIDADGLLVMPGAVDGHVHGAGDGPRRDKSQSFPLHGLGYVRIGV